MAARSILLACALLAPFIWAGSAQAQIKPLFGDGGGAEQAAQLAFITIKHNDRRERDCVNGGCLVIHNPNFVWDVTQWELDIREPGASGPPRWIRQFSGDQHLGPGSKILVATRRVDGTTMCAVPTLFTMVNRKTHREMLVSMNLDFCGIGKGEIRYVRLPNYSYPTPKVIIEDGQAGDAGPAAKP